MTLARPRKKRIVVPKVGRTAPPSGKPPAIGLYFSSNPTENSGQLYYLNLFWKISLLCRERGIVCEPFIDNRGSVGYGAPPPDLLQAIGEGRINTVIGMMGGAGGFGGWASMMGVPFVIHSRAVEKNSVFYDMHQMIRISLRRLADLGCASAGMILWRGAGDEELVEYARTLASRLRIRMEYEWLLMGKDTASTNIEREGYSYFLSLWSLRKRPEGLIVFPDTTARGVITAAIERRVRIPQDLKMVLHRNKENPIMGPFPVEWIENSVGPMAEGLLSQVARLLNGEQPLAPLRIPFRIVSQSK